MKKIIGHNFSLKWKLLPDCLLPFKSNPDNEWRPGRGVNNVRFSFYFERAFVVQTNKSLIVYPYLETISAEPVNSFVLKKILVDKAVGVVKGLQASHPGLRLGGIVDWRPSTQEYAIGDKYAKELPFRYRNEVGQIDKSRHVDESGHVYQGGEVDWFSPEAADAYIRMPLIFVKAMKDFEVNIVSHVAAVKEIALAAKKQAKEAQNLGQGIVELRKSLKPVRKRLFRDSMKKSATARGVS